MSNLNKNLQKDLKKVESLMRRDLSKEPVVKDLYDYIFDKSGKKVRASISLICSHGMRKNQQDRIKLAAVIELLHTATLVHDDILIIQTLEEEDKQLMLLGLIRTAY